MAQHLTRNSLIVALTLSQTGCMDIAYFLADKAYKEQKEVEAPDFSGATGDVKNYSVDINNYKHKQDSDYFVAIASSGGGYRATYITLGALMGLEQLPSIKGNKNLLSDIDLYSSISGSGLAVGYYLTKKYDDKDFDLNKNINQIINKDQKTHRANILRTNLDDMLFKKDHIRIQNHIKKILKTQKGQLKLKDILVDKNDSAKPKIPLWYINSTIFQNMDGITLTPRTLIQLGATKKKAYNMNVSEAVMASMAYPMAIPPLKLTSNACKKPCYLYLIDGGIFDATGITPAMSAGKQVNSKHKLILIIDASDDKPTPFSTKSTPPKPIDMLAKIPDMVTESQIQRLKHAVELLPKDTNAIILKASKFKQEVGITTRLNASLKEQKMLIKIGQQLILNNKNLQAIIKKWS